MLGQVQYSWVFKKTRQFVDAPICRYTLGLLIGITALFHVTSLYAQARGGYSALEYASLDSPGGSLTVRRINSAREVAGGFRAGSRNASSALLFSSRGAQSVVDGLADNGGHSVAFGLNDLGEAVGAFNTRVAMVPYRATRSGQIQPLDLPQGSNGGVAYAVNLQGEAAGYVSGVSGIQPVWWNRSGAVRLLAGAGNVTAKALGLNDGGDIVGVFGDDVKVAVIWPKKGGMVSLGTLPGFINSEAVSISESGLIVGIAEGNNLNSSRSRAVLWGIGGRSIQDLGVLPGGADSRARDVNARGEVVGTSTSTDGDRGFIWTAATGMLDLNTLVTVPGLLITDAISVNKTGDILVIGHNVLAGLHDAHKEHQGPVRILVLSPQ